MLLAIYLAYQKVLFNVFFGDDYDYLPWLKLAMGQPEVIWRNFHTSWMDNQSTLFYRPLITASMALEYFIWGPNGLLFRITNLGCLFLGSLFIGLTVTDLAQRASRSESENATNLFIAFMASALFALYPLHSESIVWIIGRVDSMCSVFVLGSLWFYIRWRKAANFSFLGFSVFSAILAFTCKEMAIVLPPTIAACELFFGDLFSKRSSDIPTMILAEDKTAKHKWLNIFRLDSLSLKKWHVKETLKRLAINTSPFFVLLLLYFVLRRIVLGTFVGGYDDSLLLTLDYTNVSRFLRSLTMLVIPVNQALLGWHSNFVKLWEIGMVLCTVLSIVAFVTKPKSRRLIGFSLVWFIIALVPVYKIFAISIYLEGSRLAYLATAPLCVFLSCGFTLVSEKRTIARTLAIFAACMLGVSGYLLYVNNQAWATAGSLANAVQQQIRVLYKRTVGDPDVILVGIPISYKGAYVCLNAIDGMTKFPQIDRDIFHCRLLDSSEPIAPFGFLKDSIWKDRQQIKIYYWDSLSQTLKPVNMEIPGNNTYVWKGVALKQLIGSDNNSAISIEVQPDGGLSIKPKKNHKERPDLELNMKGLPCWSTDFISIKLRLLDSLTRPGAKDVLLLYANSIISKTNLLNRTRGLIEQTNNQQEILLPLHSIPEWVFGGTCCKMTLLLPAERKLVIDEISIKSADNVIPNISFDHSGYLENHGILHLNKDRPKQTLTYDVKHILGSTGVMFEITRPGTYFTEHNCKEINKALLKAISIVGAHGQLVLSIKDFPGPGTYQLRARGLDRNGNLIGLAGDHIIVSVQNK